MNIWQQLSANITDTLDRASPAIVEILGGRTRATATLVAPRRALTVAHAMGGNDEGHVLLHDENTAKAKVLGRDEATDLALLEVDTDAEPLKAGTAPPVGTLVVAAGRRQGSLTATAGIVSDRGEGFVTRSGAAFFAYIDVDAGLPRGLSGGPLLGPDGTWLGINTHGLTRGGTTIDAQTAQAVLSALDKSGQVARGRIGVAVRPAPVEGQDHTHGLLVTEVVKGAPAAVADLRVGDVILKAGETATSQIAHLMLALTGHVDEDVTLRVLRQGQARSVDVHVEARPAPGRRRRHGRRR